MRVHLDPTRRAGICRVHFARARPVTLLVIHQETAASCTLRQRRLGRSRMVQTRLPVLSTALLSLACLRKRQRRSIVPLRIRDPLRRTDLTAHRCRRQPRTSCSCSSHAVCDTVRLEAHAPQSNLQLVRTLDLLSLACVAIYAGSAGMQNLLCCTQSTQRSQARRSFERT